MTTHVNNASMPLTNIDDAVRVSVNGSQASREVAEQFTLNSMGGTSATGVLNIRNPIGLARNGLLSKPGLGVVESIATPAPSLLNPIAAGTIGGSRNFFRK